MKIKKEGFSLIEITIVLIVVSLLIIGVVASKNLIDNTKINLLNTELINLKMAVKDYVDNNNNMNNLKISDLVEEEYLDFVKNFDESKNCYPSKTFDRACWKIMPNMNNIDHIDVGLVPLYNDTDPKVNKLLCRKFKNKFTEYNLKDEHINEDTTCDIKLDGSIKVYMNVCFYDIN